MKAKLNEKWFRVIPKKHWCGSIKYFPQERFLFFWWCIYGKEYPISFSNERDAWDFLFDHILFDFHKKTLQ